MDGLEQIVLNSDAPALGPILVDCKNLNRFELLLELSRVIGIILERVRGVSFTSYDIGLLGKDDVLTDLPEFENVKTIPDKFVPDRTLFVLTLRIDGIDVIRPASYQSWDEYFMYFFRTREPDRIMITRPHLQARLINCPIWTSQS